MALQLTWVPVISTLENVEETWAYPGRITSDNATTLVAWASSTHVLGDDIFSLARLKQIDY